jgi:hypothetical protein
MAFQQVYRTIKQLMRGREVSIYTLLIMFLNVLAQEEALGLFLHHIPLVANSLSTTSSAKGRPLLLKSLM